MWAFVVNKNKDHRLAREGNWLSPVRGRGRAQYQIPEKLNELMSENEALINEPINGEQPISTNVVENTPTEPQITEKTTTDRSQLTKKQLPTSQNDTDVEKTETYYQLTTALAFAQALSITQPDELVGGGTNSVEPLLQDVVSARNELRVRNTTQWVRYDPYSVFQRWFDRVQGQELPICSYANQRWLDGVTLTNPVLPQIRITSAWMQSVQNTLLTDPSAAKSTVISSTSANPGFAAYIVENTAGRVTLDETIWFFRMLALLGCIEDVTTFSSMALWKEFATCTVRPTANDEDFSRMLHFQVPAERIPNIPIYYANSNQFASFTRNQVAEADVRGGINVNELGSDIAVIPIRTQDRGEFLIHLIAASLSSGLWNTYLGNFYFGRRISDVGANNVYNCTQFFETKASKVIIPGPAKAVVLVVWDDAGPADWTNAREFGFGANIPCLISPVQGGGADVNFVPLFYRYYGLSTENAQRVEQSTRISQTWLEAYRYLQQNFSYGNAERRAIAAAAEMFFDTPLDPQPVRNNELGQDLHNGGEVLAQAAGSISGVQARRRKARMAEIAEVQEEVVDAVPEEPALHAVPRWTSIWNAGGDQALGNFQVPYFGAAVCTDDLGVLENYGGGVRRIGFAEGAQWQDIYADQQLMRVSPNYYLRGLKAGVFAATPLDPVYGWPHGAPGPGLRDVMLVDVSNVDGQRRFRIPRSNWLGRIACAMGAVDLEGSTLNWNDTVTAFDYVRNVAHLLGVAFSTVIAASGVSVPVWLGLIEPNQRFQTREYPGEKYDNLRGACFGKAVLSQAQLGASAGVISIKQFPGYLRRDGNLTRYLALPLPWDEICYTMNKFCGDGPDSLVKSFVHTLAWKHFNYGPNLYTSWTTKDVTVNTLDYCLATFTLDLQADNCVINCVQMANYGVVVEHVPMALEYIGYLWMAENNASNVVNLPIRTKCWTVPLLEVDNVNMAKYVGLVSPMRLGADGRVGLSVTWPDPNWWNWLSRRAVSVGERILRGDFLGALGTALGFLVRDVVTHIRTGRPAWETPDVVETVHQDRGGTTEESSPAQDSVTRRPTGGGDVGVAVREG